MDIILEFDIHEETWETYKKSMMLTRTKHAVGIISDTSDIRDMCI